MFARTAKLMKGKDTICTKIRKYVSGNDMTLYDLGIQYLNQSEMLYEKAQILREKTKTLRGSVAEEMNTKSTTLFSMAIECRRTGEYLVEYYKE